MCFLNSPLGQAVRLKTLGLPRYDRANAVHVAIATSDEGSLDESSARLWRLTEWEVEEMREYMGREGKRR